MINTHLFIHSCICGWKRSIDWKSFDWHASRLCFADCMSHRCASNIAPERQISCTTIQHAVVEVINHRAGSFGKPVGVNGNGHRALPEPSSFPTSVSQRSPKWCFCNSAKHVSKYTIPVNELHWLMTYGCPKRLERAPPLLHFRTKSTSCYDRRKTLSDLLGFSAQNFKSTY